MIIWSLSNIKGERTGQQLGFEADHSPPPSAKVNGVIWYIGVLNIQTLKQGYEPSAVQTPCSYEIHKFHSCAWSHSSVEYFLANNIEKKYFPIRTYFIDRILHPIQKALVSNC
jgi:hypothetical protein